MRYRHGFTATGVPKTAVISPAWQFLMGCGRDGKPAEITESDALALLGDVWKPMRITGEEGRWLDGMTPASREKLLRRLCE